MTSGGLNQIIVIMVITLTNSSSQLEKSFDHCIIKLREKSRNYNSKYNSFELALIKTVRIKVTFYQPLDSRMYPTYCKVKTSLGSN